jgi:hypothetical protein
MIGNSLAMGAYVGLLMSHSQGDTGYQPWLSSTQKRLIELTTDVLIVILSYLDYEDLLSLRAVSSQFLVHVVSADTWNLESCMTLFKLTYERTVWINLLRRECIHRGIFLPTFPLERMGVAQLEHAASSPSRFKIFLRNADGLASPASIRRIDNQGDTDFKHVCLVPGGRFLLTRNALQVVQLWDLGFNITNAEDSPQEIASHDLGTVELHFPPEAQMSQDGKALVVMLATRR